MDHRLYSCDDHLDLNAVPPQLWTERAPRRHLENVPHVVESEGRRVWKSGGRVAGTSGASHPSLTALSRQGLAEDAFRPSRPKARLEDMERDGVHASIVYGPFSLAAPNVPEPAALELVVRSWNDWAAEEFNAVAPERLNALAFLPSTSPEAATAELERVAALGHRGVIVSPFAIPIHEPEWDRLWAAAEATGLPVSFHIGGGIRLRARVDSWELPAVIAPLPTQLDEPLSIMMFSGALDRHPGLSLVLAESGLGWLPYFLARLDATFEKHCLPYPGYGTRTRPSELFARQVWATFEEEALGPQLIPLLDTRRLMWASDYPHPDSTWPRSHAAIAEALAGLDPEIVRRVTADNCRALYGLP